MAQSLSLVGPRAWPIMEPHQNASGKVGAMARPTAELSDPAVVVVNPGDAVTAECFNTWLDKRQAGLPSDPGVTAAETLAEARVAGEA